MRCDLMKKCRFFNSSETRNPPFLHRDDISESTLRMPLECVDISLSMLTKYQQYTTSTSAFIFLHDAAPGPKPSKPRMQLLPTETSLPIYCCILRETRDNVIQSTPRKRKEGFVQLGITLRWREQPPGLRSDRA